MRYPGCAEWKEKKLEQGVENMNEKYQENIVPAARQNKKNVFLYPGKGVRILFAGNSITRHGLKPEIGWNRECGMAASCLEKDYVHQFMNFAREIDPEACFGIAQVADFERNFDDPGVLEMYQEAADFNADIIIMFFGANVNKAYDADESRRGEFGAAYEKLRALLNSTGKARIFHSAGFYIRPVLDEEKRQVAEKYGEPFIRLDEIIARDDVRGQFNHPGDVGMLEIARRFFAFAEPAIKALAQKK